MGISLSLLLAAAGAILIWAVDATSSGFNIHTAGVILLVVGIIGFVLSLAFWSCGAASTPAIAVPPTPAGTTRPSCAERQGRTRHSRAGILPAALRVTHPDRPRRER